MKTKEVYFPDSIFPPESLNFLKILFFFGKYSSI